MRKLLLDISYSGSLCIGVGKILNKLCVIAVIMFELSFHNVCLFPNSIDGPILL